MTSASTKQAPTPTLLVYGKPTSPDLPQASWFRDEDRPTVVAAAQSLKLSVLDIQTDAERALTLGVHEGVLKSNGRMIVGSVTPEVYKRIEDYVAKASSAPAAKASSDEAAGAKAATEQTANIPAAGAAPDAWDALRVGDHVVGKYWQEDGYPNGWWIGVITAINKDDFTIRWPDEPKSPPLKIERKHVAIPHPSYDVNTEWQRRR
jgi:hypothetical protein